MRWKKIGYVYVGEHKHFVYRKRVAIINFNVIFDEKYQVISPMITDKLKKISKNHSIIIHDDSKYEKKSQMAIAKLPFWFLAFVNTTSNGFMLPNTQIWNAIKGIFLKRGVRIRYSFYCGQRAGRQKKSSIDRAFADNANITFKTVGNFLYGNRDRRKAEKWKIKDKISMAERKKMLGKPSPNIIEEIKKFPANPYYLILLIGEKFTGKKEIAEKLKRDWALSTLPKDIEITRDYGKCSVYLSKQKSVIMMGEFGTSMGRKKYINLATREQIPILVVETEETTEERKMVCYVRRQNDTSTKTIKFGSNNFYEDYSMPERDAVPNPRVYKVISHPTLLIDTPEFWFHYG